VIRDHVLEEAGAMRGKLAEWDVINEPYSNHDFMDILGKQVMDDWFKAAREADPEATFFINDYDSLWGGPLG
jgi:GH35 family endo-1,4-beta-xylanase